MRFRAALLVAAAACTTIATADECTGTRLVRVVSYCFEVPCEYAVVMTVSFADAWAGYIEPPDHSWRVTWHAGLYGTMLVPSPGLRLVWKRAEEVGPDRWQTGLVEDAEGRTLVFEDVMIRLSVPADTANALGVLKRVAAMRRSREAAVTCIPLKPPDEAP